MPHDNVKVCEEVFGKLRANHMMSPTLIQIDRANPWSACSAAIITDFLDSGHGKPGQQRRGFSAVTGDGAHHLSGPVLHYLRYA